MTRTFRLGKFAGFDVALDWSAVVAFALAAWGLSSVASRVLVARSPSSIAVAGIACALGLSASLVLHEVARAAVARALGAPIGHVTIYFLGGVSDVEREPSTPGTEVISSLASALASAAVSLALVVGVAIAGGPFPKDSGDLDRVGIAGTVALCLAIANAAIAVVSFVPAFPLAGGRLVRAAVWQLTGDVERATRWGVWLGQALGWTAIVVGVALAFAANGGPMYLGIWLTLGGWFLASAGARAYEDVVVQGSLAGISAAAVMRRAFLAVPADASLANAIRSYLARADGRPVPVVEGRRFVGMLSWAEARAAAPGEWRSTPVAEVAARDVPSIAPSAPAIEALSQMRDETVTLAVVDDGELVGVLEQADIRRWMDASGRSARASARATRGGGAVA